MVSTTRTRRVWAGAAIAMAVMVLGASSGTISLWTNPQVEIDEPVLEAPVEQVAAPLPPDDLTVRSLPSWVGNTIEIVAWVAIAMMVASALIAASRLQWWAPLRGLRQRILPSWWQVPDPLADVSETVLHVDLDAALTALTSGEPRNAIVACWMRLEQDAATMGFGRLEAETSSEYVARVVTAASVDPGPITELAALYREARFSLHHLDDTHRSSAVHALGGVVAALRTSAEVRA